MPNLLVRNIPERVYERLRKRAELNRRSLSGEAATILEDSLEPRPIDAETIIADAVAIHSRFEHPLPDLTEAATRSGRRYEHDPPPKKSIGMVADSGSKRKP